MAPKTRDARDLERLARELRALNEKERGQVAEAMKTGSLPGRRHIPWKKLRALRGLVNVGGNAVEDTQRLYDA